MDKITRMWALNLALRFLEIDNFFNIYQRKSKYDSNTNKRASNDFQNNFLKIYQFAVQP